MVAERSTPTQPIVLNYLVNHKLTKDICCIIGLHYLAGLQVSYDRELVSKSLTLIIILGKYTLLVVRCWYFVVRFAVRCWYSYMSLRWYYGNALS